MNNKLFIILPKPSRFYFPWECSQSLLFTQQYLTKKYGEDFCKIFSVTGAYIHENRNLIFQMAKGHDLLMIDIDMIYHPTQVSYIYETMKNNNLDIVCGLFFMGYMGRQSDRPYKPMIYKPFGLENQEIEKVTHEDLYIDYPYHSLFEIGACGMAFTIFSQKVVDAMQEEPFSSISDLKYLGGEDFSFCIKARRKGFKIWCDSRLNIGHLRNIIVDENLYSNSERLHQNLDTENWLVYNKVHD